MNVPISMNVDRQSSGNTRIHGKVGERFHDVNVWKGPQPGDAYIEGNQEGLPTTLRINSAFSDHGQSVFGRVAGVDFKGNWEQEAKEGDVSFSLNKATVTLDRDPATGVTESTGTQLQSTARLLNAEGDETVAIKAGGLRYNLSIDRQEDGDVEIRGRSGDGVFMLSMQRSGTTGNLRINGTIPEQLSLLPVMWELYGNDAVEHPTQPLTMGGAATLAAFWDNRIRE